MRKRFKKTNVPIKQIIVILIMVIMTILVSISTIYATQRTRTKELNKVLQSFKNNIDNLNKQYSLRSNSAPITFKDSEELEEIQPEEDKIPVQVDLGKEVDVKADESQKISKKLIEKKKANNSGPTYYIKINYTANVVTIYQKDGNGDYTIPVKAFVCSTGTATPRSGIYRTIRKFRWRALFGGVYGQYATTITGSILFHSVPYYSQNAGTLEYQEYDKLGTTASAGCIRLTVRDTKWIYDNCAIGTYVEFYSSSNPGPLGKPSAQKISSNVECRNWDPTDPDGNNPWKNQPVQKDETNKPSTAPTQPSKEPNEPSPSPDTSGPGNDPDEKEPEPTPEETPSPKPDQNTITPPEISDE